MHKALVSKGLACHITLRRGAAGVTLLRSQPTHALRPFGPSDGTAATPRKAGIFDPMRSPKQRSRSKQNRPRTLGNIINRVFDSSGPEGKVRGTPQQIIEKYQVLARDAQLSNDRVAAENFQQHAEHYTRMLAQAQREMQAEADARRIAHEEQQNRNRHQQDDRGQRHQNGQHQHQPRRFDEQPDVGPDAPQPDVIERPTQDAFAVVEQDSPEDVALVETPEAPAASEAPKDAQEQREPRNRPNPRRDNPRRDNQRRDGPRSDKPRSDTPRADAQTEAAPQAEAPASAKAETPVEAASEPGAEAKPRRNQRRPRKPAEETARAAE